MEEKNMQEVMEKAQVLKMCIRDRENVADLQGLLEAYRTGLIPERHER